MSIKPGQQLGRYKIEGVLGSGGMGSVFLAHDLNLDRRVALKTTLAGRDADGKTLERFHREAKAAANFRHPNLCKVYDVGEIDGLHYLTMEYVEGRPLQDWLRPGRPPLPVETATAIAHGTALGLAEAHRLRVVHRDLKPANIMIDREGVPVVVDFGIARGERAGEPPLTEVGSFLGTRSYASPEQWDGDPGRIGPASDVYSLGVVLYQMLSGRLPFAGPTPTAIMKQMLTTLPDPPSACRPGLDPRLDEICARAIARSPDDRFGSMGEFAQSLGSLLAEFRKHGQVRPPAPPDDTTLDPADPTPQTSPADAPEAAPAAGMQPGGLSRTLREESEASNELRKRPPTGLDTFAVVDPARRFGLGRSRLIPAIAACLAVATLGAWLALVRSNSPEAGASPEAPRGDGLVATGSGDRDDAGAGRGPGRQPASPSDSRELTVPGRAWLTTAEGEILDVVRRAAFDDAPRAAPVLAGQEVKLIERSADGATILAHGAAGKVLGWIPTRYLIPTPPRMNE